MRLAEARRSASISSSNSIRFSLGGVQVDWMHEAVAAAHVLAYLDHHLAVGKAADFGLAQPHAEMLAHFARQRRVGIAGENLQFVFRPFRHPGPSGQAKIVTVRAPCFRVLVRPFRRQVSMAGREGFEPSNARSKAWCLTNLATAQHGPRPFRPLVLKGHRA